MQNKLKSRVRTPKAASPASEIARLKFDLQQERVKSDRYRLAAESAKNLIYEWDLGSHVEWLGQVDELLGYQPNEIPRTWEGYTRLLNPEDRERVLAAVEKQLKADEPYSVECRVRRKDGTYLYWQDRGTVIRDESGKPVKWLGAVSDITERKRVELALKSLTARQDAILAATPAIIMEVDNNRIYTWSNQEGLNFFGEDVVGKEAASFFEGEQKTYQIVQPVFEGNEDVIYVESWQRRRDGQKRLLAWRCRTLQDEFRNIKGALSTAYDITERTLAEGKLVKSEALLSNALKMARAGHWEYDVDQDIFTFNDNFYRIFRTTAADVGGYQMSSAEYARRFCHPDDAAAVGNETRAAIESADPNYSRQIEHRILYADGEIGSITVRFFIVKDAHGRTVKTYGVNQDITELKQAEKLREVLFQIANAANSAVSLEELFRSIHESIGILLTAENFFIALYDPANDEISFPYFVDQYDGPPPPRKTRRGLAEYVLHTGAPLLAPPDVFESLVRRGEVEIIGKNSVDWVGVPLCIAGRTIGVMVVQSYTEKVRFGKRELDILSFVSAQIAMAIERKRVESALRESEDKFKYVFEFSNVGKSFTQLSGEMEVNAALCEMLGYSPDELKNKTWPEITYSDDIDLTQREIDSLFSGKRKSTRFTKRYLKKDGSTVWADVSSTLRRDATGKPLYLVSAVVDITEQKRADKARLAIESEFHSLAESMPQIVWITRPDGWNIYFNQQWVDYTGLSLEESYGHGWNKPFHPDDQQRAWEAWQNATKNGAVYSLECRLRRADGTYHWWLIRGVPYSGNDGKILKWFGTCTDIDSLKRVAEELKKSEASLAEAQHIAHIGSWERDFVTGELRWSDEIYRIFGLEAPGPEISFEMFLNTVHSDDRESLQKAMKEALSGDNPYDFDHRIVLRTGEIRVVHEQGVAQFDKSGKPIRMFGTAQDITDLKKAEERLLETLQSLRKAYGGIVQVLSIASEVRDPYTAGHQKRVADLARSIAQEMGLTPECVEGLRLAGNIHDIGKLSIPAEILSKPTRLSKIEFSMIQSHAQIGHDILKDIDFAWPIARIIHQHHERLDGSGYPQGLKDGDILLESRILAVADVIEAMASHRPYRPSLGIDAALREIESGKGILFDPAVVSACLTLFRKKGYVFKD